MKWQILLFSVFLGSVYSDICDLCACTFLDQSDVPDSVTCSCTDTKSQVHIRSMAPRLKNASRLEVVGCDHVVLHEGAFSSEKLHHVVVARVGLLEVKRGAMFGASLFTLSLEDVKTISLEKYSFSGGVADTVTVVRANIPNIPVLGAYLHSVKDELTLTNVTIENIERSAVRLTMGAPDAALSLENVKILNIAPGAVSIETAKVEILGSGFGPYASGIRIVAKHYAHICKNHIIQKKPNDFFDIYSPHINLTGNSFAFLLEGFGDAIKATKYGKVISYKNVIDDTIIIVV